MVRTTCALKSLNPFSGGRGGKGGAAGGAALIAPSGLELVMLRRQLVGNKKMAAREILRRQPDDTSFYWEKEITRKKEALKEREAAALDKQLGTTVTETGSDAGSGVTGASGSTSKKDGKKKGKKDGTAKAKSASPVKGRTSLSKLAKTDSGFREWKQSTRFFYSDSKLIKKKNEKTVKMPQKMFKNESD